MSRILRRAGQAILTIFAVITISFALIRLMPGGPIDYLRARLAQQGGGMTETELQILVKSYANMQPSDPLYVQYFDYMTSVLQGDLGRSIWYQESVNSILLRALPWTVFLMGTALLISFTFGIAMGALMAYNEKSTLDQSMTVVALVLKSIPYYVLALAFIFFVAYPVDWLPESGSYDSANTTPGLSLAFLASVLLYSFLPILSVFLTRLGPILSMRANAIGVLGENQLRVARLRGLKSRRIVRDYVIPNSVLPLYTGFMISLGNVFGGSVILETIFTYPGVGYYIVQAIRVRDYTLMMGGFLVITVTVVIAIFIADLTYGLIDPRVSFGGDSDAEV